MKADIHAAQEQIAQVVRQAVEETFNAMFCLAVLADTEPFTAPDEIVLTSVKLNHGSTDLDFLFKFDMRLLLQAAARVFAPEYLKSHPMHQDIAFEIANIVCHRVKAYLNEQGYHTDMGFPFVPSGPSQERVHMHFFYRDTDAKRRVGVAVNYNVT